MSTYNNILLSCTLAIGDVVMATSAAVLLKKVYPMAKISIIVKPLAKMMVMDHPVIDEVFAPEYEQKKASFSIMRQLTKNIKHNQYDLFISLDGKVRTALIAFLAGIPVRVGPSSMFGSNTKMPLLMTHTIAVGDFKKTHYVDVLGDMVRSITGTKERAMPMLPRIRPENEDRAESLLFQISRRELVFGFCVKTNPLKTWPAEKFARLMDQLSETYAKAGFYIIGEQHDCEYVEKLISMTSASVSNFTGKTTLLDFAALLKRTDVFITLDTAPMHIASAVGVPLVAIFCSTAPKSVAPLSQNSIVLAPEYKCIPCIPNRIAIYPGIQKRIAKKSCSHKTCMELISPDCVYSNIIRQIKSSNYKQ